MVSAHPYRGWYPWFTAAMIVVLTGGLIATAWVLSRQPWEVAYHARTEQGVIEQTTVLFYGLACVLSLCLAVGQRWRKGWYGAAVFLTLGLRELDFDTRFTPEHIDSIRYWRLPDVPLTEKLMVAIILLVILFAVGKYIQGSWSRIRTDLRLHRTYPITLAGILAYLGASYGLDEELDTSLIDAATHITATERTQLFWSLLEECIELGIPILICIALLQWGLRIRVDSE